MNDEPLMDGQTDGHAQNVRGYNIIPRHFFVAGHKKSNIIRPFASQNTVAITLPADGCGLNFFDLRRPGPNH